MAKMAYRSLRYLQCLDMASISVRAKEEDIIAKAAAATNDAGVALLNLPPYERVAM